MQASNCQHSKLEQEHDHHGGLCGRNDGIDAINQEPSIEDDARDQADDQACVEKSRISGWLLLEDLDPALADPSPDLACDQGGKHDQKESADLFAEYGHGEAGLGDGKPGLFVELFDLDGAKGTEAEPLQSVHEGAVHEEDQVDEDH